MGKTFKKSLDDETDELKKLKIKYENRRNQIKRLKNIIRELEKKLEKYEAGIIGTSDKGRPDKSLKRPKITIQKTREEAKRELIDKLKAQFGNQNGKD
jgi:predicted  nucleic acid-binding Zn-ribbon protein